MPKADYSNAKRSNKAGDKNRSGSFVDKQGGKEKPKETKKGKK